MRNNMSMAIWPQNASIDELRQAVEWIDGNADNFKCLSAMLVRHGDDASDPACTLLQQARESLASHKADSTRAALLSQLREQVSRGHARVARVARHIACGGVFMGGLRHDGKKLVSAMLRRAYIIRGDWQVAAAALMVMSFATMLGGTVVFFSTTSRLQSV